MNLLKSLNKKETISKLIQLNKSLSYQIYKDDKIDTMYQMVELIKEIDDIALIGIYCQDSLIKNINITESQDILLKIFNSKEGKQFLEIFIKNNENIEKTLNLMFNGHSKCKEIINFIIKINEKVITNAFINQPILLLNLRKHNSFILKIKDEKLKKLLVLDSIFEYLIKNFKNNIKIINYILKDNIFSQNYFIELKWNKKLNELNEKELIIFLDSLFNLKNNNLHKFQSFIKEEWIYLALKLKKYSLLLKFIKNNPLALKIIIENLYLIEYSNNIEFIEFMAYLMKFKKQIEYEIINNNYIKFEENIFLQKIISNIKISENININTLELITLFVYLQVSEASTYDFISFFKESILFILYSIKKYNSIFIIKYLQLILFFDFDFSNEEKMFLRELKEFNEDINIKKIVSIYLNENLIGYLKMFQIDYQLRDINLFIKKYLIDKIEYFIEKENQLINKISNELKIKENLLINKNKTCYKEIKKDDNKKFDL